MSDYRWDYEPCSVVNRPAWVLRDGPTNMAWVDAIEGGWVIYDPEADFGVGHVYTDVEEAKAMAVALTRLEG